MFFVVVCFNFMLFMVMKSDINKLICILFVHLSSIILENFKKVTSDANFHNGKSPCQDHCGRKFLFVNQFF